jgi:N6-adenosine-specific RNA methylase IME4
VQQQQHEPVCVELFARELFPGWLSWGNECIKFQDMSFWEHAQPGQSPD